MATTTNYGWDTPDDTDLVKDGAAAIRTLGSSVDTTTKALNPSTTLGDLEYRSATANTNTRLGIGSTGDILTVTGGVPVWAAPGVASKNFSLINTGGTSLTGSTVTITGLSGYDTLYVFFDLASTNGANIPIRLRTNSYTTADYAVYGGYIQNKAISSITNTSEIMVQEQSLVEDFWKIAQGAGAAQTYSGCLKIEGANSTGNKMMQVYGFTNGGNLSHQPFMWGYNSDPDVISQIQILVPSGAFDAGTIRIYGAA
jgi:hypothetical protein